MAGDAPLTAILFRTDPADGPATCASTLVRAGPEAVAVRYRDVHGPVIASVFVGL